MSDEICPYCGEDCGHEPDCPEAAMEAMQEDIERMEAESGARLSLLKDIRTHYQTHGGCSLSGSMWRELCSVTDESTGDASHD